VKTDIFIVTYAKDFPWLKCCLRSIQKFARGFSEIHILVPTQDVEALGTLVNPGSFWDDLKPGDPRAYIHLHSENDWPDKGMVWHMNQIMHADQWCPTADFIAHIDADCIFTHPVTPETYILSGKPILRFENFAFMGKRNPNVLNWQRCTEACLPFPVHYETMRCHPGVFHRDLYAEARHQMEFKTGKPVPEYIRSCRNEYPQTFCEFVTLGNVAMHLFPFLYHMVEQINDLPAPPNYLQQFWSHGPIDQPQDIWVNGKQKLVVPLEMIREYGLT